MVRIFIFLCLMSVSLPAQNVAQSTLPDALRTPGSQKLIFHVHGIGDQIYTCKEDGGKYTWTLKAPEAQLLGPDGKVMGHHFAGPTWQAQDGSSIVGKPVASAPSPDPHSIAWLRIEVIQHAGGGTMEPILSVQRLDTQGGKAPGTGCDALHSDMEARIAYQAEYYFYGKAQ